MRYLTVGGTRRSTLIGLMTMVILAGMLASGRPARASEIVVDTTEDEVNADSLCSLREAIISANENALLSACEQGSSSEIDGIVLAAERYVLDEPGVNEENAATGDLDITDDLRIFGAGVEETVVTAMSIDRVFDVKANTEMSFLKVRNGSVDASVGGAGGGGIRNSEHLTLRNVLLMANSMEGVSGTDYGGALANLPVAGARITVIRSELRNNRAYLGGAIGGAGTFEVRSSLIFHNSADSGGGIYNTGVFELSNSTVNDNDATATNGGAISQSGIEMVIRNSTIYDNNAEQDVANLHALNGVTKVKNSIIGKPNTGRVNCEGAVTSLGHNLEDGNTCGFTTGSDFRNRSARLRRLINVNGGPTATFAMKSSSPARNHGGGCLSEDQRGVPRRLGGHCDIGAYEFVKCEGKLVNVVGTGLDDFLIGTPLADGMLGLGGSDFMRGAGQADGMCGGKGGDLMGGSSGADKLSGEKGADRLHGGTGRDSCDGGPGNDQARLCERRRSIP